MHGNGYLPEGPHGLGQITNSPQGEVRAQTELPSTRPGAARLSHLPAVSPAPFLRPRFHCPLSLPQKSHLKNISGWEKWGEAGKGYKLPGIRCISPEDLLAGTVTTVNNTAFCALECC